MCWCRWRQRAMTPGNEGNHYMGLSVQSGQSDLFGSCTGAAGVLPALSAFVGRRAPQRDRVAAVMVQAQGVYWHNQLHVIGDWLLMLNAQPWRGLGVFEMSCAHWGRRTCGTRAVSTSLHCKGRRCGRQGSVLPRISSSTWRSCSLLAVKPCSARRCKQSQLSCPVF